MRPNLLQTADLVTFTEEIFNGKLHSVKLITCTSQDKILIGLHPFLTFLSFSLTTSTNFSHLEKP